MKALNVFMWIVLPVLKIFEFILDKMTYEQVENPNVYLLGIFFVMGQVLYSGLIISGILSIIS